MVLASPDSLLTAPPCCSPPKTPIRSYSAQTPPRNGNPTPPRQAAAGGDGTDGAWWKNKYCSECGGESSPARRWLPAAGGDRAWAVRTGSGPMRMCGDIFAAARLWRGRLLTTGRLSCRHPIVVCAGRGGKLAVAGRSVAWACSGRGAAICVRVFSSVSHCRNGHCEMLSSVWCGGLHHQRTQTLAGSAR